MPNGHRSNSCIFSLPGCGAWSVAMASTTPETMPSITRSTSAFAAERRLHFVVAVVGHHVGVAERHVVRRHFAGDGKAPRPGVGDHLHSDVARGEVRDVKTRAGKFRQQDVAGHHHVFRGGRDAAQAETHGIEAFVHVAARAEVQVLAVIDDGDVEGLGEFHRAAHHARFMTGRPSSEIATRRPPSLSRLSRAPRRCCPL